MLYFATSVFMSAFLLFQIQPMIGKLLLPWFGGTPTVWSTVMLFFQLLLIGGYAYAYWLISNVSQRKQSVIHLTVLAVVSGVILTLFFLWPSPVTPTSNWKSAYADFPIWHIFVLLTISVGLPYFILATNAPLMQAWFSKIYPGRSPYKLYSLSNIGSLLALISYPFLIEPMFSIHWQGMIWSIGFTCFVLLVAYVTVRLWRNQHNEMQSAVQTIPIPKPLIGTQLLWIALSACASLMLLATTNQITQEIAAIPFLWILPLTIYLLSFIFTFSGERWYNRLVFSCLLLICSIEFMYVITVSPLNLVPQIGAYSLLLFACCMICNGELYNLRPHSTHLTRYYLMIALGGAIGGMMVSVVAPLIFPDYWELKFGFALCWLLLMILVFVHPTPLKRRQSILYQSLILTAAISACVFALRFVLTITDDHMTIRNFYGVIHVKERYSHNPEHHIYLLNHGATLHGFEFIAPKKRDQPTAYYFYNSGIGLAITRHPHHNKDMRVGVLGLGAGTLATYGQPGDIYRFYEINPAIAALAKGQGGYFHFLQDSRADINIVLGDALISLERELAEGQKQNFDVLALDTFSSDAIPIHLLTREAFAIYLAHLATNGILAVHISNRNLDLQPVVWQLAQFYQLQAVRIDATSDDVYHIPSSWILLSRDIDFLSGLVNFGPAHWLRDGKKHIRLWTDDYSNLFQVLK